MFLTLASTYYLLEIGDVLGITVLGTTGGYVAILTALLAVYVAFAEVINWAYDGTVIPLGGTPAGERGGSSVQSAD